MFEIRIDGLSAARAKIAALPAQAEAALVELAEAIYDKARDLADEHTKTGALIRSLGPGPRQVPGGWQVGHDTRMAPHALFVHWGTKPHAIKPKRKRALRWVAGGAFTFAKSVRHPGYKGDPWLVRAADSEFRAFASRFHSEVLP